jgi:hypothetical protein
MECTVIVQLFKLSESGLMGTNDQSQGSIDLQRFARPLGVIMVLSGLFIQVLGESCDATFISCILISIGRHLTFLHDPGGPLARLLPGGTQLPCCSDICPRGSHQHRFHSVIF